MKGVNEPANDDDFPANILPYDEVEEPVSAGGFARYMLALAAQELERAVTRGGPEEIATWSRLHLAAQRVVDGLRVPVRFVEREIEEGPGRLHDLEFHCYCAVPAEVPQRRVLGRPRAVHYRARLHEGEILDPRWVERTCPACEPPATAMVPRCCHCRSPLAVYSVQDGLYQGYAAKTGLPAATRGRRP